MSGELFDDVVIHLGYHKTGSSLLQRRVFTREHRIYSEWDQGFYHQHVMLDRPDAGWALRIRAAFEPGILEARRLGLTPVLSCEALSGDIWRLGQANGYGNFHVAEALAHAFPGFRAALVHREQCTMIASLYKHSLRSHWRFGLRQFLDQTPLQRGMAPLLNFGYLEYSWLVEHYRDLLGAENVFAVPFERMRHRVLWAKQWSDFLKVNLRSELFAQQENRGFSAATAFGKRFTNYAIPAEAEPNLTRTGQVLSSLAFQADARVPSGLRRWSDEHLAAEIKQRVGRRFEDDNQRLLELVSESWAEYGYRTRHQVS